MKRSVELLATDRRTVLRTGSALVACTVLAVRSRQGNARRDESRHR